MNKLIVDDTLYLSKGDIFLLNKGKNYDVNYLINKAKEKEPSLIISSLKNKEIKHINNIKKYLKNYINNLNIHPTIIGVTGSNGKTSTTTIIYNILKHLNKKVMLIGTNGVYFESINLKTRNTTISNLSIHYLINKYLDNDSYLIMELSSQGYERIKNIKFDYIIYTNLDNEHLDYHKTMNNYFKAKIKILNLVKNKKNLIINKDDYYGNKLIKKYKDATFYSLQDIQILNNNPISFIYKNKEIKTLLTSDFNIYNIFSSYLLLNKILKEEFIDKFLLIKAIKGRNNLIKYKSNKIIIDYAHTPKSVENIVKFYKSLNPSNLYVILGFGGNKDIKKRSIILKNALNYTNNIIITEDNSRNEEFINIIKSSLKEETNNLIIIQNRKEAIRYAISLLKENDTLLILGKGNEEFILKNNKMIKHSDYKEVTKWIN